MTDITVLSERADISGMYDDMLRILRRIHEATGGGYPALEFMPHPFEFDAPGYWEWFDETYPGHLTNRLGGIRELVTARRSGKLVGFVGVDYYDEGDTPYEGFIRLYDHIGSVYTPDIGFIELLGVDPDHQGGGLGRVLVERALAVLGSSGKKVHAVTFPWLSAANALYAKLGGKVMARVSDYQWMPEMVPSEYLVVEFTR